MKKMQNMTCIICPLGCNISLTVVDGAIITTSGATCNRGVQYVTSEFKNPVRTLTTTVKISNGIQNMLPVKSNKPLAKELLFKAMEIINNTQVKSPIYIGDVIVENILNTDIDIVSTKNM